MVGKFGLIGGLNVLLVLLDDGGMFPEGPGLGIIDEGPLFIPPAGGGFGALALALSLSFSLALKICSSTKY